MLLLNRGAKPGIHLIEVATDTAQKYPTELNIKLLELLNEANAQ